LVNYPLRYFQTKSGCLSLLLKGLGAVVSDINAVLAPEKSLNKTGHGA
jgi:hypothetical protein